MYCPFCKKDVALIETSYKRDNDREILEGKEWQCSDCKNCLASSESVEFNKGE
jgi:transcriptional regulator NrdR family protein